VVTNDHKISRKIGEGIYSTKESKIYKTVFTKRALLPNSYDTAPFGKKMRISE
jgi:hypothetical protein